MKDMRHDVVVWRTCAKRVRPMSGACSFARNSWYPSCSTRTGKGVAPCVPVACPVCMPPLSSEELLGVMWGRLGVASLPPCCRATTRARAEAAAPRSACVDVGSWGA
eukprot:1159145-Pelagomonas_calceolata.AAC.38